MFGDVTGQRSRALTLVRDFFHQRDLMEVDTPCLMDERLPESEVAGFIARGLINHKHELYLQTSPEYAMKQLLARGSGDIYQIAHVFRDDPQGELHSREFTMIEWYRLNSDYRQLQQEACELINRLCEAFDLAKLRLESINYAELFHPLGVDPWHSSDDELGKIAAEHFQLENSLASNRSQLLDCIFFYTSQQQLRDDTILWAVEEMPTAYSPFAKRKGEGKEERAESFELFWQGVELANGCNEETDIDLLASRYSASFWHRLKGLPECSGIALGFDRLLMLLTMKQHRAQTEEFLRRLR